MVDAKEYCASGSHVAEYRSRKSRYQVQLYKKDRKRERASNLEALVFDMESEINKC